MEYYLWENNCYVDELFFLKYLKDVEFLKVFFIFFYVFFLLVVFGVCYLCVYLLLGKLMKSELLKFFWKL